MIGSRQPQNAVKEMKVNNSKLFVMEYPTTGKIGKAKKNAVRQNIFAFEFIHLTFDLKR